MENKNQQYKNLAQILIEALKLDLFIVIFLLLGIGIGELMLFIVQSTASVSVINFAQPLINFIIDASTFFLIVSVLIPIMTSSVFVFLVVLERYLLLPLFNIRILGTRPKTNNGNQKGGEESGSSRLSEATNDPPVSLPSKVEGKQRGNQK